MKNLPKGYRKSLLLGIAAILCSLLVCVLVIRLYKLAVPENVNNDIINITSNQYESALTKWGSQTASEYEITISRRNEVFTLRVSEGESKIYLLEDIVNGGSVPVPGLSSPVEFASYVDYTVGGMFNRIKNGLDSVSSGRQILPGDDKNEYSYEYNVQFDSTLGYPSHIYESRRTTRVSREITWRDALPTSREVKGLRIIK